MADDGPATEADVREALDEAERRMGMTDDEPDFRVTCPGCGAAIEVWDEDDLPMGYECFQCAANYSVEGEDEVVLIDRW